MSVFSFINLDIAKLLGGAINPCAFTMPFLYEFAVHMCMLPGFISALFMAYYLRGYGMELFHEIGTFRCCKWYGCGKCQKFFSSGAGKNTAILRIAKADAADSEASLDRAITMYQNMITKFETNLQAQEEKFKLNDEMIKGLNKSLKDLPKETKEEPTKDSSDMQENKNKLIDAKKALKQDIGKIKVSIIDANKLKKDDMEKLKKEDQEAKQSLKDAKKLSGNIKKETENAKNRLTRWINMFIFFIFPGITMKSFLALRCRRILDTDYLASDLSQECWVGDHGDWGVALAISAIVIYAIGVPLFTWFSLYRVKAAMFDKKHPDYIRVHSRYGNLFQQYEPQFWFWEVIEMIRKLLLTGGLVLAADGTSAQFLIAQVISLLYLVLVIRYVPYENDTVGLKILFPLFQTRQLLLILYSFLFLSFLSFLIFFFFDLLLLLPNGLPSRRMIYYRHWPAYPFCSH